MSEVVLYHNPRCSKSRATLALLRERGVEARVVEYLDKPLTVSELEDLARKLGRPVGDWVRTGESAYAEAGLSAASSAAELLAAMAEHPILMERPIAVNGEQAAVGRPPENVLAIL
jgi:arsenate reductase